MFDVGDLGGVKAGPVFEATVARLHDEVADVAGVWHAAAGRLVALATAALRHELWAVQGVHTPAQWLGWQCGIASGRARQIMSIARRADELPACIAALEAGEISLDSAAVIARGVPGWADEAVTDLAKLATVRQLSTVVNQYSFEPERGADPDKKVRRQMRFGAVDEHRWRMIVETTVDEGAAIEAALTAFRDRLFQASQAERQTADENKATTGVTANVEAANCETADSETADSADVTAGHAKTGTETGSGAADVGRSASDICWVDAFMDLVEHAMAFGGEVRPHSDRYKIMFHYDVDEAGNPVMHPHGHAPLPETLRRLFTCDATISPVWRIDGVPVSVGRSQHIVPRRTRRLLERRDGGCRVPGCTATRWVQVHHIVHWEDFGPTDTYNLVCLCPHHHRLHHRGLLGITGNADDPDGLAFTDQSGKPLRRTKRRRPPGEPPTDTARRHGITARTWQPPLGEHIDHTCVDFGRPPPHTPDETAATATSKATNTSTRRQAGTRPPPDAQPATVPRTGGPTSGCGDPPAA